MQNISNIIFDLGGIFISIDYAKTEQAFIDLGVTNFNALYNQHHASNLFELLETGKITPPQFYDGFREISQLPLTNDEIKNAWNAMLGDFHLQSLEGLLKLKPRYKIFLYSNTNIIHWDAFNKIFHEQTGLNNFDDYFIKAYYSHDLGFRKPYPEGFLSILTEQKLLAHETLFIDDTIKNVEGAAKAGLQTIHLVPPKTILDLQL